MRWPIPRGWFSCCSRWAGRSSRSGREAARSAGRSSCRTRARSSCCCCCRSPSRSICRGCSRCRCRASPARAGVSGSFATGALAAFVATPCTGPFMGAALGAALVLPWFAALAIFGGLGLGLALPFLAIGFVPGAAAAAAEARHVDGNVPPHPVGADVADRDRARVGAGAARRVWMRRAVALVTGRCCSASPSRSGSPARASGAARVSAGAGDGAGPWWR